MCTLVCCWEVGCWFVCVPTMQDPEDYMIFIPEKNVTMYILCVWIKIYVYIFKFYVCIICVNVYIYVYMYMPPINLYLYIVNENSFFKTSSLCSLSSGSKTTTTTTMVVRDATQKTTIAGRQQRKQITRGIRTTNRCLHDFVFSRLYTTCIHCYFFYKHSRFCWWVWRLVIALALQRKGYGFEPPYGRI